MDVSLDDIIKKNKLNVRRKQNVSRQNTRPKKVNKGGIASRVGANKQGSIASRIGTKRVTKGLALGRGAVTALKAAGVNNNKVSDLRLRIGSKKASGSGAGIVRDAREKLNKSTKITDARQKLIKSRSNDSLLLRGGGISPRRNPALISLSSPSRRKMIQSLSKQPFHGDMRKQATAYMDLEQARLKKRNSIGPLLYRTVDNIIEDNLSISHRGLNLPDMSYLRGEPGMFSRHQQGPRSLMSHDSWIQQPSIQDITSRFNLDRIQPITRTLNQDDVWSQSHLPSLSSLRGNVGVGNGVQINVNAKRRLEREEPQDITSGYRIVVSNLQPSVTHEDIKELFEDIGSLISSSVVRPGTAEVVYKNMEDAVKAVDTYHNRQLDGQPMKCLLVKPSNMSRLMSKGSVVPDLHAIHKALFNK